MPIKREFASLQHEISSHFASLTWQQAFYCINWFFNTRFFLWNLKAWRLKRRSETSLSKKNPKHSRVSYMTNGRGEAKGLNFFTLALKKTTPAAVVVCWNSVFHSGGDIVSWSAAGWRPGWCLEGEVSPLLNFYGGVMGIPARRNATQRHGGRNPPTGHTHTCAHPPGTFFPRVFYWWRVGLISSRGARGGARPT